MQDSRPLPRSSWNRYGKQVIPFPLPPRYFERVCDEYDVLLVFDKVICAFSRAGSIFICYDFDYQTDMITLATRLTLGYSLLSTIITSDKLSHFSTMARRRSRTAIHSAITRYRQSSRWPTPMSSSARTSTNK